MPDAEHYDQVATRYDGDRLAMWLEDAVDAADEEAERAVAKVPGVPKPGEQVGPVPETRTGTQPEGRTA